VEFPNAIQLSAHDAEDVTRMHAEIVGWFERDFADAELFVPWAQGALVGEIHTHVRVLEESYEDDGVRFRVRGRRDAVGRIESMLR
jgi:GTP-binding protein HflX